MIWLGCIVVICVVFIYILFKTAPEYIELGDGSMERVTKNDNELPVKEKKENDHSSDYSEFRTTTHFNTQKSKKQEVTIY